MRFKVYSFFITLSATGLLLASNPFAISTARVLENSAAARSNSADFENIVQPVLANTCAPCHNDRVASGGLNLSLFSKPGAIAERRAGWEKLLDELQRVRAPPTG